VWSISQRVWSLTLSLCFLVGTNSCQPRLLGSVCHTSQRDSAALMVDCVLTHCLEHSAAATTFRHTPCMVVSSTVSMSIAVRIQN